MRRPLAWVLSGGGARGALQVGAVRALLEADIQPDMLLGTSIGAVNAAYLAVHGVELSTVDDLVDAWHDAAAADLLSSNHVWLTIRALLGRGGWQTYEGLREFFVAHGLSSDLRFDDIESVQLALIAADLNAGRSVVYGTDPNHTVLDGLLASTALPPWVRPLEVGTQSLVDGGVVTSLPIEPAVTQGAKEIVALDLLDSRDVSVGEQGVGPFIDKVMNTVEQRQRELEMALAAARGVPVHRILLRGARPVAIWDFSQTDALIARGYEIARDSMRDWAQRHDNRWRARLASIKQFITGR